jgi:hypothetical protein
MEHAINHILKKKKTAGTTVLRKYNLVYNTISEESATVNTEKLMDCNNEGLLKIIN